MTDVKAADGIAGRLNKSWRSRTLVVCAGFGQTLVNARYVRLERVGVIAETAERFAGTGKCM
jgi:hypothetical protein